MTYNSTPNDIGVVDLAAVTVIADGGARTVVREGQLMQFEQQGK